MAYRYLCLTAHYRSDISFTWESLDSASVALGRLRQMVHEADGGGSPDAGWLGEFRAEMAQDLNSPKALAVVWGLAKANMPAATRRQTLLVMDDVLGLGLADWSPSEEAVPAEVLALLADRDSARAERNWPLADALRDRIQSMGYDIEDGPDGSRAKRR